MKRFNSLFAKVVDTETIRLAISEASKGKRNRKSVMRVLDDEDTHIMLIQSMLLADEFKPSAVNEHEITERGKFRKITTTPFFPDQIIHWAVVLAIQHVFLGSMYEYTLATIRGRGSGLGKRKVEQWLKSDPKNTKYCLKLDVNKFYTSVNHDVLKVKLRQKFKDKRLLKLLDSIIDSYEIGLPLGLYTSQWFANFYLSELDHNIKNKAQAKYYLRYMDDLVIFGPNKKKLHKMQKAIERWLVMNKLIIKVNWQVFKTDSRPIDFLGFKFYRNRTTIRSRNFLKIRRKYKRIKKKGHISLQDAQSMMAYWGWIKNSNSYRFYNQQLKPICSINKARRIISNGNLRRNPKSEA